MKSKSYFKQLIFASLIAAIYAGLTYAFAPISYKELQFRISEVLTIIPCFSPAGILGLTVGCFLANFGSFNPIDLVFGTGATLIASIITYLCRNIKVKGLPLLSFLAPVIVNALIVGFELTYFFAGTDSSFIMLALSVGLGEAVVCFGLGIPFYILLNKHSSIFDKLK